MSGLLMKYVPQSVLPVFLSQVKYYENKVDFVVKVKIKGGKTKLAGKVEYMVCNDEKCLPPAETEFAVAIGG